MVRRVADAAVLLAVAANVHHLAVAVARWWPYRCRSWDELRNVAGTVREFPNLPRT